MESRGWSRSERGRDLESALEYRFSKSNSIASHQTCCSNWLMAEYSHIDIYIEIYPSSVQQSIQSQYLKAMNRPIDPNQTKPNQRINQRSTLTPSSLFPSCTAIAPTSQRAHLDSHHSYVHNDSICFLISPWGHVRLDEE